MIHKYLLSTNILHKAYESRSQISARKIKNYSRNRNVIQQMQSIQSVQFWPDLIESFNHERSHHPLIPENQISRAHCRQTINIIPPYRTINSATQFAYHCRWISCAQVSSGGARGPIDFVHVFTFSFGCTTGKLNTTGNTIVAITIIAGIIGSFRVDRIGPRCRPELMLFPRHRVELVVDRIPIERISKRLET